MIQTKVLGHIIDDFYSFRVFHDIFLKNLFPGVRQSRENFISECGSCLHAVSLR